MKKLLFILFIACMGVSCERSDESIEITIDIPPLEADDELTMPSEDW